MGPEAHDTVRVPVVLILWMNERLEALQLRQLGHSVTENLSLHVCVCDVVNHSYGA